MPYHYICFDFQEQMGEYATINLVSPFKSMIAIKYIIKRHKGTS